MAWNEPKDWLQAAKAHAKAEGTKIYRLKPWLPVFALFGAVLFFEWNQADPVKRLSPLGAAMIFLIFCSAILGLARLAVALNSIRTSLREYGILHGPRFSPQWIPYDKMEIFWIEDAEMDGRRFRFLTWFEAGEEEEMYAVIPEKLNLQEIVDLLKSKSVKQDFLTDQDGE